MEYLYPKILGTLAASFATTIAIFARHVHLQHKKFKHIPGPPRSSFWLGSIPDINKAQREGKIYPQLLLEYAEKYGETFVIWIMWTPMVFTIDLEGIRDLLIAKAPHKHPWTSQFSFYLFGERLFGNGLIHTTDYHAWKHRRTAMNPAFKRSFLKKCMGQFNENADALVRKVRQMSSDQTASVPMLDLLSRVTLDIIGKVAFDMDIGSLDDENQPFPRAISQIFQGIALQVTDPLATNNPFTKRQLKKDARAALKMIRQTCKELLKSQEQGTPTNEDVDSLHSENLIEFLLKANGGGNALEGEDLETAIDDFISFFIAGQDTTANVLGSIIMELGRHPEILLDLQEEIADVIATKREMSFEDLSKLTRMTRVIKEGLRMYPSIPFVTRGLASDATISNLFIPSGTLIGISSYSAGRYSKYHKDPAIFNPDRFNAGSLDCPPTYSYLPFALGPRNCIGQHFAMIEIKTILSALLQNFTWKNDGCESFELSDVVTIKPKDGVCIMVEPR